MCVRWTMIRKAETQPQKEKTKINPGRQQNSHDSTAPGPSQSVTKARGSPHIKACDHTHLRARARAARLCCTAVLHGACAPANPGSCCTHHTASHKPHDMRVQQTRQACVACWHPSLLAVCPKEPPAQHQNLSVSRAGLGSTPLNCRPQAWHAQYSHGPQLAPSILTDNPTSCKMRRQQPGVCTQRGRCNLV